MIHNAYIRDNNEKSAPIYVPNEFYSFYMNFTKPITDPNFDSFRLDLMKGDAVVLANFAILMKDEVTNVAYNIYAEFVFPFIPDGCYYFAIFDTIQNKIKCTSNCIHVFKYDFSINSQLIQFRHKRNRGQVYYEHLPVFYQRFRLPLNKVDYQYEVDKKQYRNASDKKLRNQYTYKDKTVKVESYYFDEGAHDAMAEVYEHDDIIINGTKYMTKDGYTVETNQQKSITKGSVVMYEQERVFYPTNPDPNAYVLGFNDTDEILEDGSKNIFWLNQKTEYF